MEPETAQMIAEHIHENMNYVEVQDLIDGLGRALAYSIVGDGGSMKAYQLNLAVLMKSLYETQPTPELSELR